MLAGVGTCGNCGISPLPISSKRCCCCGSFVWEVHTLTTPNPPRMPYVWWFLQVEPSGQHVYLLHDTPFGNGQQPHEPSAGSHACAAQLCVAGHAVRLYAGVKLPQVVQPAGGVASSAGGSSLAAAQWLQPKLSNTLAAMRSIMI